MKRRTKKYMIKKSQQTIFCWFQLDFRSPAGYDRTRGVEIGNKNFKLTHLEEAYTSEHWLVRIYKVKDLENREKVEKPTIPAQKWKKRASKKVCFPLHSLLISNTL